MPRRLRSDKMYMDYRAVFAALQLAALLYCANSQLVDLTLVPNEKGKSVVRSTVRKIAESGIFPDDLQSQFLMRMAFAETNNGEYADPGDGGIWAISPRTLRYATQYVIGFEQGKQFEKRIASAFGFNWTTTVSVDYKMNKFDRQKMDIPLFSALAVMLHLKLFLLDKVIPEDKDKQKEYWKDAFQSSTPNKTARFNDYVQGIFCP